MIYPYCYKSLIQDLLSVIIEENDNLQFDSRKKSFMVVRRCALRSAHFQSGMEKLCWHVDNFVCIGCCFTSMRCFLSINSIGDVFKYQISQLIMILMCGEIYLNLFSLKSRHRKLRFN